MNFDDKLYCSIAMGGWAEIGHTGEPESSPNVNGDVYPCCPGWLKDDTNPAGYDFGNLIQINGKIFGMVKRPKSSENLF